MADLILVLLLRWPEVRPYFSRNDI